MNQSWECHKCHAVNAPHVNQCPCSMTVQPFIQQPIVVPIYPSWPSTAPSWPNPGITWYGDNPNPPQTVCYGVATIGGISIQ